MFIQVLVGAAVIMSMASASHAQQIDACRTLLIKGEYAECVDMAAKAIEDGSRDEAWWVLKTRCLLQQGLYSDALEDLDEALNRYRFKISVRYWAHIAYKLYGQEIEAQAMLEEITTLATRNTWRYTNAPNLVTLGRTAVILDYDPGDVLEVYFDRAKKENPRYRETYLAIGELALSKNDFAEAGRNYQEAEKFFPDDPDIQYGLARAFAGSDTKRATEALTRALELNPNHWPARFMQIDRLVDSEHYEEAKSQAVDVLGGNTVKPEAWAYLAVVAHLENQPDQERSLRDSGLSLWSNNPAVDHLIGRKLSQKYRFEEGAAYQRAALSLDPDYLPAKIQLAQDLLRLGIEEEGWRLAQEVYEADGYDVTAYNLVTLKDVMDGFRTIEDGGFVVRMDPREADIYGSRVLDLLKRAKAVLPEKYGVRIDKPITVEIFPQQKDFGVRTFGMPVVGGYLGVCFGSVITANSPASQGATPSNWESVLWHEYAHVVTLTMTKNKMPRWLSEGISVYEERQANPAWGQKMNPRYREMILGGEMAPIARLSGSFLHPPSPLHLQFAYYQSSLVVEHLIERYGLDSLKQVLTDLGEGVAINAAIEKRMGPLKKVEKDFDTFARERATNLAPEADFETPKWLRSPGVKIETVRDHLNDNPNNFAALNVYAVRLIGERKFEEAKEPLHKLIELYPEYAQAGSAYGVLASVHRALEETDQERAALRELAKRDGDAVSTFLRLMDLDSADEKWEAVTLQAQNLLAVNPLIPQPHRHLAHASEALDRKDQAIESYNTLLVLEPPDPADVHYRLAKLLLDQDGSAAKRHVLQALEEAPRFRDAHRLLLEMVEKKKGDDGAVDRRRGDQRIPPAMEMDR